MKTVEDVVHEIHEICRGGEYTANQIAAIIRANQIALLDELETRRRANVAAGERPGAALALAFEDICLELEDQAK